uniref:YeeW-like domain-containing protein n=1 Tax=Yersinia pseudotuberculosis serotype O:3 (strain YPIII) TaxID=502800 RepID=A0A0H3B5K6_YERPY
MKISMNIEVDGINVLALNMGKIAVEVDGVIVA